MRRVSFMGSNPLAGSIFELTFEILQEILYSIYIERGIQNDLWNL